jgi:hypothetical protein
VILALALLPPAVGAEFSISFNFVGGLSGSQQEAFQEAKATWERYISGYQPGITQTGLTITAQAEEMDGNGGTLASAGPTSAAFQGGFWLARAGSMTFDSSDLADLESEGTLSALIAHEIGHVLGLGTLWDENTNGVYVNGSGRYTGAFALDAYRDEFDPLATFVPVELEGGPGTMDAHWDEMADGLGATGLEDPLGRDMAQELMTGWMTSNPSELYISNTTLGSLRDIGFEIAVPEPGVGALTGLTLLWTALLRRRRTAR